jgi:hypothetical protein
MTVPLSDAQLAAITARHAAATAGQWRPARAGYPFLIVQGAQDTPPSEAEGLIGTNLSAKPADDMEFIFKAHDEDVPALLAEVHRLRAENAGLDDLRIRAIDKNDELRTERPALHPCACWPAYEHSEHCPIYVASVNAELED